MLVEDMGVLDQDAGGQDRSRSWKDEEPHGALAVPGKVITGDEGIKYTPLQAKTIYSCQNTGREGIRPTPSSSERRTCPNVKGMIK